MATPKLNHTPVATTLKDIWTTNRSIIYLFALNFVLSIYLFAASLITYLTSPARTIVRYVDIGTEIGFVEGSRSGYLAWTLCALILGPIFILLAIRLYTDKSPATVRIFVCFSILLLIFAIITFSRIAGSA